MSDLPDIQGHASLVRALSMATYRSSLEAAFPAFMQARRWFAGRAAGAFKAQLEEVVPLSTEEDVALAIVRVENAGGIARYQVPLLAAPSGGVVDALDSAAGAQRFLDALLRHAAHARFTVTVTGSETIGGAARVVHGEQSNTSVTYGDACILKLFRRLAEGRNPDVELTSWLSGPGGFAGVPRTLAWGRLDFATWNADSVVIQRFVTNDGDGWQWALRGAESAASLVASGVAFSVWLKSPAGSNLLEGAGVLGMLTADLHAALASATGEGMRPTAFNREDWDALVAEVHRDIDAAVAAVAIDAQPSTRDTLARLHGCVPAPPATLGLKMRVHGDYHLGQVLHTRTGWVIVDFEGEPARPLAERVALQHPLTDVAGMLRSCDYAAVTSGGSAGRDWADAATSAFLDAYRSRAAGSSFLPETQHDQDALLRLLVLRKALYELRYELDSRPAWAAIPLGALERIAMEAQ